MNWLTVPWITEVVIIGWRDFKNHKRPPYPSEFLATFVIFGLLSLPASNANLQRAAQLFGWGVVLATFFNFVDPTFSGSKPPTTPANPAPVAKNPPGSNVPTQFPPFLGNQ